MKVCKMCGKPEDGFGPCKNCGSYSFIEIGGRKPNRPSAQPVVSPNESASPNIYTVPSGQTPPAISNVAGVSSSIGASVAVAAKGKAAMGAGKIVGIILSILLVVAVGIAVPVVVTQTNTPEATIAKLEKAFNDGNINEVMECFDSETRNAYKGADDLFKSFSGFSFSSAANVLPFLAEAMGEDLPNMKITVNSIEKEGPKNCIAHVTVQYSDEMDPEEDTIEMVKENGKWYVSSDDLLSSF